MILIVTLIVTVFDVLRRIYLVKKTVTGSKTRLLSVCSFTFFILVLAFLVSQ